MSERAPGRVQSVVKAMDLLACLAQAGMPLALGELSRRTGIPKATVHGLLAAMRPTAVVEQSDEDGKYRLGVRLFEYGCVVSGGWNILEAAQEPMRQAAEELGETVGIAQQDRGSVLVLDCAEGRGNFRVVSERGSRLPLHCTSQGKLLLSFMSPAQRRTLLRGYEYTSHTEKSISCQEDLEKEMAAIQEQGYSIESGELRIGLQSVAVPVYDVDGKVVYALAVVRMLRNYNKDEMEFTLEVLSNAAHRISYGLGYRGNSKNLIL